MQAITSLVARLARHGLTAAGAFLASKGIVDEAGQLAIANLADVVAGAALFGIGILWSWLSDKFISRK